MLPAALEKKRAWYREYYKKNRAKFAKYEETFKPKRRAYAKLYRASIPQEERMFWPAKRRAKARGLEFSITLKDIHIPEVCPLLGIPLYPSTTGKPTGNSPSLDRKDSSLGYTKENVWVISKRANTAKNNLTVAEIKLLASNLEKHLGNTNE